jgi:queuine/archaeosine tRNA-ribosyltransferase
MEEVRSSILDGSFAAFKAKFLTGYHTTDEQVRLKQKEKWLKAQEHKT